MSANGGCSSIVAAEFDLGTLTVSGNTFSGAGTMPTRRYNDKTAVQTASTYSMLVVNTALTATTPVVTITYTDQSGNTGNTATLTLPTSPVINTAFLISPHLANADTGIRAITNMSISTGSAGILKVYGLLPIALGTTEDLSNPQTPDIIPVAQPMWQLKGADSIAVYQIGKATVDDAWMTIAMIGDTA
jgi:hypothetical protein